jgi:hypothetical protein
METHWQDVDITYQPLAITFRMIRSLLTVELLDMALFPCMSLEAIHAMCSTKY